MNIETKCGNCAFFKDNKDKHGSEGACVCNPPQVFPLMGQDIARRPTLTWMTAPHPAVGENHTCGHRQPAQGVELQPTCKQCGEGIVENPCPDCGFDNAKPLEN